MIPVKFGEDNRTIFHPGTGTKEKRHLGSYIIENLDKTPKKSKLTIVFRFIIRHYIISTCAYNVMNTSQMFPVKVAEMRKIIGLFFLHSVHARHLGSYYMEDLYKLSKQHAPYVFRFIMEYCVISSSVRCIDLEHFADDSCNSGRNEVSIYPALWRRRKILLSACYIWRIYINHQRNTHIISVRFFMAHCTHTRYIGFGHFADDSSNSCLNEMRLSMYMLDTMAKEKMTSLYLLWKIWMKFQALILGVSFASSDHHSLHSSCQ